jgi:nucleoside-diphosphate-sugar epimerase
VRGLARSDAGAEQLKVAGAEVQRGDLEDLNSSRSGAAGMDAVVNLAFNHDDMSKFAQSAKNEIKAIETMGSVLEPGKLLLVTSGVAVTKGGPDYVRKETDPPVDSPEIPRKPEQTARAVAEQGVHVGVLRMPQVHDTHKQGLVMYLIQIARGGWRKPLGSGSSQGRGTPLPTGYRED